MLAVRGDQNFCDNEGVHQSKTEENKDLRIAEESTMGKI
jgi:hypothetical protein